jgi:acetolactate synthase-1/2/3 large subunit
LDANRQTIIQINVEPLHVNWTLPADIALIGDARQVLAAIVDQLRSDPLDARTLAERQQAIRGFRERHAYFHLPRSRSGDASTHPQRVVAELQTVLDQDAIITCDAGENRLFMNHYFQVDGEMAFLQPASAGGMGYAIPAALAARAVHPDRQVVAVCGDGGFAMTMLGLMTSIEEHLPIVVVIFNNRMLGWVRHGQGDRPVASHLGAFDHAAIARSMGADGMRITDADELGNALKWALDRSGTAVIDVVVSEQETFLDLMSPLARERR